MPSPCIILSLIELKHTKLIIILGSIIYALINLPMAHFCIYTYIIHVNIADNNLNSSAGFTSKPPLSASFYLWLHYPSVWVYHSTALTAIKHCSIYIPNGIMFSISVFRFAQHHHLSHILNILVLFNIINIHPHNV